MAAVDTVFEQLGKMTVLELVELKKKIEDEWGITARRRRRGGRSGRRGRRGGEVRGEDAPSTSYSQAPARRRSR